MKGESEIRGAKTLTPDQWKVNPPTGVISITEETIKELINTTPIENVYTIDPEPIARGQFAVVYHCLHRITGEEFAAKFSSRWRLGSDCTADIVHEIAVCAMLKPTTRTVQLVDVFSTEQQLILVMEYAPGGDLQTLLDENLVPYEHDVIKFMRQLLEGLAFIHERNIVHLDIKPQNLVLMGEFPYCAVKLCDFEISRMLTPGYEVREILGTPDYVAPEILHYEPITTRTDMWSVGVLTYVLLTGFLPFGGESDQETFMEILKCELDFPSELFEDITPEAIDFISKLLIRHPERRMSAQESLDHPWIKKDGKRPEPPKTLNLQSPLNVPLMMPVTSPVTFPDIKVDSETTSFEKSPLPKQLILTKTLSDSCYHSRDCFLPKDIGRPPLHPSSSQKSLFSDTASMAGTPVLTPGSTLQSPFIYRQDSKFGSRHNLDRLRSLSKSREVLSERVQMSNLKKSVSKSRERLCEAKLGITKSREQLMALSSLSQSVEALSALSHLHQQDNILYQSCNNIYVPKLLVPQIAGGNNQCRMYQSMAAIDKIGSISKIGGFFDSQMSLNTDYFQNDEITQSNTNRNCFIGELSFDKKLKSESRSSSTLRANSCKGGRRGDSCSSKCSKHKQPEPKLTQKIYKVSRAEKMKRDAQKKRKEKRDRERQERLKNEKLKRESERQNKSETESLKTKAGDNPSSPSFRRGSVSHVEQRLQERHERNQERLEKLERENQKNRKRASIDIEGNCFEKIRPKSHSLGVTSPDRPRSITPTRRRKTKKEESTIELKTSDSSTSIPETKKENSPREEKTLSIPDLNIVLCNDDDEQTEIDADLTLEDINRDNILSRSKSTESNSSYETDRTVIEIESKDDQKLSSDDEPGMETLSVSEKILSFEKGGKCNLLKPIKETKDLFTIRERRTTTPILIQRSISNTSDIGSVSESSECSAEIQRITGKEELDVKEESLPSSSDTESQSFTTKDELKPLSFKEDLRPITPTENNNRLSPDVGKNRGRSLSVYSSPSPPPFPVGRSRSNSFNFSGSNESLTGKPWGNVCTGAVARAFEKFNLKPNDRQRKSSALSSPSNDDTPSIQ